MPISKSKFVYLSIVHLTHNVLVTMYVWLINQKQAVQEVVLGLWVAQDVVEEEIAKRTAQKKMAQRISSTMALMEVAVNPHAHKKSMPVHVLCQTPLVQ